MLYEEYLTLYIDGQLAFFHSTICFGDFFFHVNKCRFTSCFVLFSINLLLKYNINTKNCTNSCVQLGEFSKSERIYIINTQI